MVLLSSSLLFLFPLSTRIHHSFPPKEGCRNKFSNIQIKNQVQKNRDKWSKFAPLKRCERKEVMEDPNLVANGKFQAYPWNESNVWRPMGKHHVWCQMEGSNLGGFWNVPCLVAFGRRRRNILFTSFHFSPHKILLQFFSIDFKVLFYHGSKPLLHVFPSFSFTYKLQSCISRYQFFHTFITKLILIKDIYFFLEFMLSHMITSYGPQAAQMNEESPWESSLNLTLTQHLHDEDLELWKVCPCFEIKPPWAWYYRISLNFCTLVVLL